MWSFASPHYKWQEIAIEHCQISNFQGLVTLTLTLDRAILHTIMHHSSTSTYQCLCSAVSHRKMLRKIGLLIHKVRFEAQICANQYFQYL